MTDAPSLRLVDEVGDEDDPKVFARSISTPPGPPWDQARAAHLEARAGAPLPLSEVSYQLRRLDGWRPGRHARFAAFYVRTSEIGARLTTRVDVDGRPVDVTFVSRGERERQTRGVGMLLGVGAGAVLILFTSLAVAISARQSTETQLAALEQLAAAKARLARTADAERHEASQLNAAGVRGRELDAFLADLDWVAAARTPAARIQAVHWQNGAMVIEARGTEPPLTTGDRQVMKMDKPLQPGVWLWGVKRLGAAAPAETPP